MIILKSELLTMRSMMEDVYRAYLVASGNLVAPQWREAPREGVTWQDKVTRYEKQSMQRLQTKR